MGSKKCRCLYEIKYHMRKGIGGDRRNVPTSISKQSKFYLCMKNFALDN